MNINNLAVFCGSSPGRLPVYAEGARALGESLASRSIRLVYGGGNVGLMGVVAEAVLEAGGEAVGVIPESLVRKEIAHDGLTELRVTRSMHERKALMAELSDGFIALPGGVGTLEELFETWTWAQLGFHAKPFGFLNVDGYFDALIAFLDHVAAEGFVREPHRSLLLVDDSPKSLLERFERYEPTTPEKWAE